MENQSEDSASTLNRNMAEMNKRLSDLDARLSELNGLFKDANQEMSSSADEPILEKLDEISRQNEKIASAILALADLINPEEKEAEPQSTPVPQAVAAAPAAKIEAVKSPNITLPPGSMPPAPFPQRPFSAQQPPIFTPELMKSQAAKAPEAALKPLPLVAPKRDPFRPIQLNNTAQLRSIAPAQNEPQRGITGPPYPAGMDKPLQKGPQAPPVQPSLLPQEDQAAPIPFTGIFSQPMAFPNSAGPKQSPGVQIQRNQMPPINVYTPSAADSKAGKEKMPREFIVDE
jgi:hypothetical protein